MTTIVYKDGVIATDTRMSSGNVIVSDDFEKRYESKGCVFFLCGGIHDAHELVAAYPGMKISDSNNSSGFVVDHGDLMWVCSSRGVLTRAPVTCVEAYGSGMEFALAACDHGKSAKEAVEYAMSRDSGTGGRVRCYDAVNGNEINDEE